MKRKMVPKVIAMMLTLALIISMAACKKKSGTTEMTDKSSLGERREMVSEQDPYFTITETELPLPVDKEKTVTYSYVEEFCFIGDYVAASYMLFYEGEEDGVIGKALFNREGHLVMDLSAQGQEGQRIVKIIEDRDHELSAITFDPAEYSYTIRKINLDGTLGAGTTLPVEIVEESEVLFLQDGNLLIANWGELVLVSPDGDQLASGGQDEFLGRIFVQDEKYYGACNHYSPEDWDDSYTYIQEIDPHTCEFIGEKYKCPDIFRITAGGDGNYLQKTDEILKIDILDESKNQTVFNWNDTDYDNTNVTDARIISEQEYYFLDKREIQEDKMNEKTETVLKLLHAVRAESNPYAGKKIVRVAAIEQDVNIKKYVTQYNLNETSTCRIELYYYSLYEISGNSGLDLEKNLADRIALDMLSGNGPDILMNASWLSRFNTEDVLVDLNPFIDAADGTGIQRSDYYDNLFRASEVGGKLYHLPVTFYVTGWTANRELLGEKKSYTYQEFLDAAKALPDDVTVLSESPYNDLLSQFRLSEFVDYQNKQVHFDDPEFAQLLELVKTYGSRRTHEQIVMELQEETNSRPDTDEMFRENMLAFSGAVFADLSSYARTKQSLGGKAVFCGIPSSQGGSMMARVNVSMAISAFSKNQKEAWDFIRFMVSEEQQETMTDSVYCGWMPVSREAMRLQNETILAMSKDSVENYVSDPKRSDSELPVEITEETVSEFIEIVESIRLVSSSDPSVMAIVLEEAPGYFTGQRSVEKVCDIIQNRAKTIVQERG